MSGHPGLARVSPLVPDAAGGVPSAGGGYQPGACNIGPWEIRRRRAFAIVGYAIAAAGLAVLVAAHAPAASRLLLLLPLWGGTFSWLQARRRFCAAFAMAGIVNFGDGETTRRAVTDPEARRADRMAVLRMTRDSFLVGLVLTLALVLLPV